VLGPIGQGGEPDAGAIVDSGSGPTDSPAPRRDALAARDTGVVAPPDVVTLPCPKPDELFTLGAPCEFSGTCTIDLDPCMTGEGSPTQCVCPGGFVELPPGEGIGCSHTTTPPACPPNLAVDEPCDGDTVCTDNSCGADDPVTCTCADGFWSCPGLCTPTGPPPPLCGPGGPCASGPCQESDGCGDTVVCTCVDGGWGCPAVEC
jgi:hypothetical protein